MLTVVKRLGVYLSLPLFVYRLCISTPQPLLTLFSLFSLSPTISDLSLCLSLSPFPLPFLFLPSLSKPCFTHTRKKVGQLTTIHKRS